MKEVLLLKELDQKYRQVCGLYVQEKARADRLAERVQELTEELRHLRQEDDEGSMEKNDSPSALVASPQ